MTFACADGSVRRAQSRCGREADTTPRREPTTAHDDRAMTDGNSDDGASGDGGDRRGIRIEFGLSLRDLLGGLLGDSAGGRPGAGSRPAGRPTDRTPTSSGSTEESDGEAPAAPVDAHLETYRDGDELTVVADLPGVEYEDVAAGIAEGTNDLVVLVDETVVERVSLPWTAVDVAGATFNNGVLELRLDAADEVGA